MTLFVRERADLWRARAWALAAAVLLVVVGFVLGWWLCQNARTLRAADGLATLAESYLALRPVADSVIRLRASVPLASCP